MSSKLAKSAGLIGAATMASRLLGVGREMVLAAVFGATCADGRVQRRLPGAQPAPGPVRRRGDDGGLRADLHPDADQRRQGSRLAARQPGHERADPRDGCARAARDPVRAADHRCVRSRVRRHTRQARTDHRPDPDHAAVPHHARRRRRDDGHAQFAPALLRAVAVTRRCSTSRRSSAHSRSCR